MKRMLDCYDQYLSAPLQRLKDCLTFSRRNMELKTRLESFFCDFNRLVNVKGLDVALNCGNHHFKKKGDASCAGLSLAGFVAYLCNRIAVGCRQCG
jgi:hypothetical protein